ncbi:MAG: hypothetical protein HKO68_11525, partial [Desulfobacterales bacterium]|nr:hypothetical protein [Desulfobacterales bacterium]
MKAYPLKSILFVLTLILSTYLITPTLHVMAQETLVTQPDLKTTPTSPEELDSYLSEMSDEQVRQAYSQRLKQDAEKRSDSVQTPQRVTATIKVFNIFYSAAGSIKTVLKNIENLFTGKDTGPNHWEDSIAKLSGGKGAPYLFGTFAGLAAIIGFGLILRRLFQRTTVDIQENLLTTVRLGKLQFLGRVLSNALLDALGIGVYVLVTFIIFVVFYEHGNPNYIFVSTYLLVSYYVLAFSFGAKIIFSPHAARLRLFPMDDRIASFLYWWIIIIAFIAGFVAGTSYIFGVLGLSRSLHLITYGLSGVFVILAIIIMILQSRKRVALAMGTADTDQEPGSSSLRAALARKWHYFAILYVLVAGGIWVVRALNYENPDVVNLILSIFLVPIIIGVDQWVQR